MSRPLKNREQFFKLVEEGLQLYFDTCDRYWGGILHLTVGVKCGEVGGIIKSENMLSYEGFTLHRIESILKYVLPKYIPRTEVGFAVGSILDELRMEGTPSESSQARRFCEPKVQSAQPMLIPHRPPLWGGLGHRGNKTLNSQL